MHRLFGQGRFMWLLFGFLPIFFIGVVQAQSPEDIVFPVQELGGCKDKTACKTYCAAPEHQESCADFAVRHGLMSEDEATKTKKMAGVVNGPGGCVGQTACEAYCADIQHVTECVAYAEKHELVSVEELEEMNAVARAVQSGHPLPGGCTNKNQCHAYCDNPAHMPECIAFAEAAGFMSADELAEAKKIARAVQAGHTPPKCGGRASCEAYCQAPGHMRECMDFALAAGLMSADEAEEARRVLPLLERGETPGRCTSKQSCEAYCENPEHMAECMEFGVKAGFISGEEAEQFRKIMPLMQSGQMPGGCRSKSECEAFCKNPVNRAECTAFARKAGLLSQEDVRQMEEGRSQMQAIMREAPADVRACIIERFGADVVSRMEAGTIELEFSPGNVFEDCFNQFAPRPSIPAELRECLIERLGAAGVAAIEQGGRTTPDTEAVFHACGELMSKQIPQNQDGNREMRPPQNEAMYPSEDYEPEYAQEEMREQSLSNDLGRESASRSYEPQDEFQHESQPPPPPYTATEREE